MWSSFACDHRRTLSASGGFNRVVTDLKVRSLKDGADSWHRKGMLRARLVSWACVLLLGVWSCGGRAVGSAAELPAEPKGGVGNGGAGASAPNRAGAPAGGLASGGVGSSGGEVAASAAAGAGGVDGTGWICLDIAPSPVCDFGLSCGSDADCGLKDCYVPGTQVNPICAKRCSSNRDCPGGTACTGPFGDERHCFVLCDAAAQCLAINADPGNPLDCVDLADPRAPEGQTVCAQASEP